MQTTHPNFDSNFKSLYIADALYKKVLKLKLPYYLKDQIRRSSSSVVLNLVEGNAQWTLKSKRRFYRIAYASCKETQAVLKISNSTGSIQEDANRLGAYLFKLIQSLS